MADYDIFKSDGNLLVTITDGTTNSTASSLTFIGRGIVDYAQNIAENRLHVMENFANTTAPSNPVTGQLWWDTSIDVLKVFNVTFVPAALQIIGAGFDADNNKIINVTNPSDPQDVATKDYVDTSEFAVKNFAEPGDDFVINSKHQLIVYDEYVIEAGGTLTIESNAALVIL